MPETQIIDVAEQKRLNDARNTWSWGDDEAKPLLREARPGAIQAAHQ
jgi:hypothetical protein